MRSRRGAELPQLELDCMIALWRQGESSAAAIRRALAATGRPLAYTTVLTVLQRLRRKQMIAAYKRGRAYWFAARVSRDALRAPAVERLVRNYFDSDEELRRYLSETAALAGLAPEGEPRRGLAPACNGAAADFDASLL